MKKLGGRDLTLLFVLVVEELVLVENKLALLELVGVETFLHKLAFPFICT